MVLVMLLILHMVSSVLASGTVFSKYLRSNVMEEPDSCNRDIFLKNAILETVSVRRRIACASLCTSTVECRRFLHDPETSRCSLYRAGSSCNVDIGVHSSKCFRQLSVCNETNCTRCPVGYYGDQCQHIIQDCSDGAERNVVPYMGLMSFVSPLENGPVMEIKCLFRKPKSKLKTIAIILIRNLYCTEVDFNRTWQEYADGFGNVQGNYWLGLDNIYRLMQNGSYMWRFRLDNNDGAYYSYYWQTNLTSSSELYRLYISDYIKRPSALGDSLTSSNLSINGMPFSTYDRDYTSHDCPARFGSGWWFRDDPGCSLANVFGKVKGGTFESSIHWREDMGTTAAFTRVRLSMEQN